MSEEEIINKFKEGDKSSFDELVRLHRRNVINICYRFLLNKEDAEDAAQEVFIEVYHSLKNYRGDAKLSTWIYRIAVSRSLDEIKKRNRKKRISSIGKTLGLEHVIDWLSGHDQPDKKLEEKESFTELIKALNALPENQRVALTLSKIEGYSNTEVAEIMQTTLVAVDSLIYRAKQNLKNFVKK